MGRGPGGRAAFGARRGETAASLISEISAYFPEARSIVITGYARRELVQRALSAGAWD